MKVDMLLAYPALYRSYKLLVDQVQFSSSVSLCNRGKNWWLASFWGSSEWSTSDSLSNFYVCQCCTQARALVLCLSSISVACLLLTNTLDPVHGKEVISRCCSYPIGDGSGSQQCTKQYTQELSSSWGAFSSHQQATKGGVVGLEESNALRVCFFFSTLLF